MKLKSQKILSESNEDDSIIRQKMTNLITTLKSTVNDIGNDWGSKEREDYIFNQVISLGFVDSGEFILKNKESVNKLKSVYNSDSPNSFTTKVLSEYFQNINENNIFFIKEPFGSKSSPDFLIITSKGILGIEDKSSKDGKVSFNTGTPGGNKFIMYYDRKEKKIYLVSGSQWGWGKEIEKQYKSFTKDMINYAKSRFEEIFGDKIKGMTYYARPMLVDKNKIKDIWDKDEKDVMDMLKKYL